MRLLSFSENEIECSTSVPSSCIVYDLAHRFNGPDIVSDHDSPKLPLALFLHSTLHRTSYAQNAGYARERQVALYWPICCRQPVHVCNMCKQGRKQCFKRDDSQYLSRRQRVMSAASGIMHLV